jgi:hypothetical protein
MRLEKAPLLPLPLAQGRNIEEGRKRQKKRKRKKVRSQFGGRLNDSKACCHHLKEATLDWHRIKDPYLGHSRGGGMVKAKEVITQLSS